MAPCRRGQTSYLTTSKRPLILPGDIQNSANSENLNGTYVLVRTFALGLLTVMHIRHRQATAVSGTAYLFGAASGRHHLERNRYPTTTDNKISNTISPIPNFDIPHLGPVLLESENRAKLPLVFPARHMTDTVHFS